MKPTFYWIYPIIVVVIFFFFVCNPMARYRQEIAHDYTVDQIEKLYEFVVNQNDRYTSLHIRVEAHICDIMAEKKVYNPKKETCPI